MALVLFASPRNNGYTKKLLDAFIIGLAGKYDVSVLDCYKIYPHPCTACGVCESNDMCAFHDLDEYNCLLNKAELLVFASPVYNLSVPSPLKAIIDRSQRYFSKRFSLKIKPPVTVHKKAILLLTCGSDDQSGFDIIEKQLSRMFTIINTELYASVCMPNTDTITDTSGFEYMAHQTAQNLIKGL